MKVRVKFKKTGIMKFIGHLDVMRYFQKVNRRAGVDIAYSGGFSPHQIMSFASPLGLGLTSEGEYLDMEILSTDTSDHMVKRMNETMAEGMEIISFLLLPETAKPAMSVVAAADYLISQKEASAVTLPDGWQKTVESFFAQDVIPVLKKTKKNEKQINIRPMVYQWELRDEGLFVKLSSGSAENLKPELLLEALYQYAGKEYPPYSLDICRLELYAGGEAEGEQTLIPLEAFGKKIEAPIPREVKEDMP